MDKKRNQEDQKLTIYFGRKDTIHQLDEAYEAYREQFKGLAVSRNRFFGALIVEGIQAFMKDESIGWAYV